MTTKMIDAGIADVTMTASEAVVWKFAGKPITSLGLRTIDHIYQTAIHGNKKGIFRIMNGHFFIDKVKTMEQFENWKDLLGITPENPVYRTNILGESVVANDMWLIPKFFAETRRLGTDFMKPGSTNSISVVNAGTQRSRDIMETAGTFTDEGAMGRLRDTTVEYGTYVEGVLREVKDTISDVGQRYGFEYDYHSLGVDNALNNIPKMLNKEQDRLLYETNKSALEEQGKDRSMGSLLHLEQAINTIANDAINPRIWEEVKLIKENINKEIERGLHKTLPKNKATELFSRYTRTKAEMHDVLDMRANDLYKEVITNRDILPNELLDQLVRFSDFQGKKIYSEFMSKLPQKSQYEVEGAIVHRILDKHTAKGGVSASTAGGVDATHIPRAYEELTKRKYKDPVLNKFVGIVKQYADVFETDVDNAVEPRGQFVSVNFAPNYLRRFLPGYQADIEAYARLLNVFKNPTRYREPRLLFDDMKKRLPLEDRTEFQIETEKFLLMWDKPN